MQPSVQVQLNSKLANLDQFNLYNTMIDGWTG